jgi:phospholipase D1/2
MRGQHTATPPLVAGMDESRGRRLWIEVGVVLAGVALLAAAWKWTPLREWVSPERLRDMLEPYRSSWLGLPVVVTVFVLAELVLFPVLVLVFVCGLTFGPWEGALYAMAGAVASALPPYFLGRRLGRRRIERWGGAVLAKLDSILRRKGIVAVFLVRKIPAPYSLVNLACGASGVRLADFVLGTALGMATGIVLITVLGAQFLEVFSDPEPRKIAMALGVLAGAVALTLLSQHLLNRRLGDEP